MLVRYNIHLTIQVEGTVYVIGSGDCGQLGLGEDVTEKTRPGPVHLPDGETVCRLPFIYAYGLRMCTSISLQLCLVGIPCLCRWDAHSLCLVFGDCLFVGRK